MEKIETAVLCDAMHALGYEPKILSLDFKRNFDAEPIIGRARTIELKPLDLQDKPEQLYDGLFLLDTLKCGDIIVVSNGFKDCAYFGELMSTFSKRNGAVGAIIDGFTRDKDATIKLGFPVFAKGWTGRDLRDRGTVKSVDSEVLINGISINKGDLICADGDGIVVIPEKMEESVLKKAKEILDNEKKVKCLLKQNKTAKELIQECGEF